ncbi:MAG: 1-acyl-sn-glycerol-3-phosphate acyltransferase [Alphaproteobacteria bacterium]|jgi:1-acyl-sn-glycerol-3-phosphate acyltransferase|nr:1-acyl-sn-glycerol-3-phosphate acyltransferase [Alphaproteobacteria bacterium]MCB1550917.1 1-acyl-sn-glycerol-3-phosphate acyltransferase [Alphaproteobacteria bacterium]MCB9984340.1 1-acyl-sn-glycerol-3-phosphate acyltransferase [Micavibrio sp.]HRK97894.1 lysophospholipid acyltransferase family protein [Alphaproteobacteria bacterium]
MTSLLAVFKIFLMAIWSIPLVLIQICVLIFHKGAGAYIVPRFWHKGICKIIGLKTEICGEPVHGQQLIYISNHLSYLDIPVIGSYLLASFIAKEEVAHWPVLGFLSKVQQTAFISRTSAHAKKVTNALDSMLKQGKSLILFPEGTSAAGTGVLPFKSSLFSLAMPKDMKPIPIQPFIINLILVNGEPTTSHNRDLYSWYGDMDFAPHIWKFMKNKGATVRLTFLPVVQPDEAIDRKALCRIVQDQIESGLIGQEPL